MKAQDSDIIGMLVCLALSESFFKTQKHLAMPPSLLGKFIILYRIRSVVAAVTGCHEEFSRPVWPAEVRGVALSPLDMASTIKMIALAFTHVCKGRLPEWPGCGMALAPGTMDWYRGDHVAGLAQVQPEEQC